MKKITKVDNKTILNARLAVNLNYYRKKRKLTQRELSKLSGLGDETIRKIERQESSPRLHTINMLAQSLQIDPLDLFLNEIVENIPDPSNQQTMDEIYAVYKGEEYVTSGTGWECMEDMGVTKQTFMFYLSDAYKKRVTERKGKNKSGAIEIIELEDEEEDN